MMFKNLDEALSYIRKKGIEEVDFKYTDIEGRWRHLTIPARRASRMLFQKGEGIDTSSVKGFGSVEKADAVIVPDISSGFRDEGKEHQTVSFICTVRDCDTGTPIPCCSRSVAHRAEEYLHKSGVADLLLASPEFEFHIVDDIGFSHSNYGISFAVLSPESTSDSGRGLWIQRNGGYHSEEPFDALHWIRAEITKKLFTAGVEVKYHHHEAGGPSQVEIEVLFKPLLASADDVEKGKYLIRTIAHRAGKVAIFLPKPLNSMSGNGMHVHMFLKKGKKDIFYDRRGPDGLSRIALHFIGGILKHGAALTGLGCGSTNSFRRLLPGYEAPISLSYSPANRSAAIRIPEYAKGASEKRIEFRISDATANPYLLFSALLLAGMDGIQQRLDPGKPARVDLFTSRSKAFVPIPHSLADALHHLDGDRAFLRQGNVFDDSILDEWIRIKEDTIARVRETVHPIEYELYHDI
jgi:glutamine synthetase